MLFLSEVGDNAQRMPIMCESNQTCGDQSGLKHLTQKSNNNASINT